METVEKRPVIATQIKKELFLPSTLQPELEEQEPSPFSVVKHQIELRLMPEEAHRIQKIHMFDTYQNDTWRVGLISPTRPFSKKMLRKNAARMPLVHEILDANKNDICPGDTVQAVHSAQIAFFQEAWDDIVFAFYDDYCPKKDNATLNRYTEVNLDIQHVKKSKIQEYTSPVDFIGIGPDNRIFVIEFGKQHKLAKTQAYGEALTKKCNSLFTGMTFSDNAIEPYVAYYDYDRTTQYHMVRLYSVKDFSQKLMSENSQFVKDALSQYPIAV